MCGRCEGTGAEPGSHPQRCPSCGGAGRVRQVMRTMLGQMVRETACPDCRGRGVRIDSPCRDCRGAGHRPERRIVQVAIPAGIEHGQRVVVRGQGHAGDVGAPPGDLYVLVAVQADPRFQRDGNDLVTAADLTITQAALGATLEIETLDGAASLEFKPATQPGEVRLLRGLGMPSVRGGRRGNLRVLVNVVVPRAPRRRPAPARRAARQPPLVGELRRARAERASWPASGAVAMARRAARRPLRPGRPRRPAGGGAGAHARGVPGRRLRGGRGPDGVLVISGYAPADARAAVERAGRRSLPAGATAGARSTGPSRSPASGSGRRGRAARRPSTRS